MSVNAWIYTCVLFAQLSHGTSNHKISGAAFFRAVGYDGTIDNFTECYLRFADYHTSLNIRLKIDLFVDEKLYLQNQLDIPTFNQSADAEPHLANRPCGCIVCEQMYVLK